MRGVSMGAAIAMVMLVAGCETGPGELEVQQQRGAELYARHCVACHGGATGGAIGDIPPRHNAEGHTWHHPDCELVAITREGMPPRAGYPEMPAFEDHLTDEQIQAILTHIKTWWEPEQRQAQAEITEQVCDDS